MSTEKECYSVNRDLQTKCLSIMDKVIQAEIAEANTKPNTRKASSHGYAASVVRELKDKYAMRDLLMADDASELAEMAKEF